MEKLNELEFTLLEKLSNKYPLLKEHIPYLRVKNREITGVGMYVKFCYLEPIEDKNINIPDGSLSANENIEIESLKNGLGYEVDISKGKVNFIEFITYNEEWDGSISNFSINEWEE
jgi:hypothetical protein